MPRSAADLTRDALELPVEKRSKLALALVTSLDSAPDADYEREWSREIANRLAALDAGTAQTVTSAAVFKRTRARLRRRG